MFLLRLFFVATLIVANTPAFGQANKDIPRSDPDFDLPGQDLSVLIGDGGVDLGDADFIGNS